MNPARHVEVRQVVDRLRQIDVTAFGDAHGVGHRFGKIAEDRSHFLRRLQIELVAVVAEPVRVVDRLAGADAQQDVVRPMIRVLQVVDVVRADERQVEVARDRRQPDVHDALVVDALVLHLEEEVPGAEDVTVGRRRVQRLRLLLGADPRRDFPFEAAAEADEARRVRRQQFLVDARLVVEPFGVSRGDELDQVVVALPRLGEEHQMVRRFAGRSALGPAVAGRHVHFTSENRVDAPLARLIVKDDRREHVAVLGNGERRHLELDGTVHQLLDAAGAVEERVLGVQV